MPPAALVASTSVRASGDAPTRVTGALTPVEVSLWGYAYTSTPSTGSSTPRVPPGVVTACGASSHGALAEATNFAPNSPKARCALRRSMRPKAAMSQKAVDPPLPSTTS